MANDIFKQFDVYGNPLNGIPNTASTQTQNATPLNVNPAYSQINDDGVKPEDSATRTQVFAQNSIPLTDYKEGDLWFDSDDGNSIYRANASLDWVSVRDGSIAGKITTFRQASVPTALSVGDLWVDTDNNNTYRATNVGDDQIAVGEWVQIATLGATPGTDIKDSNSVVLDEELVVNYVDVIAGENITAGDVVCYKPEYVDLTPSDDSYTRNDMGDTNFGTETTLKAGVTGGNSYRTFLKFDLSSIPSAYNIYKAELILYANSWIELTRDIRLKLADADWDENTITANAQPGLIDTIGTTYGSRADVNISSIPSTMTWDITQVIRQMKAGAINNYGFEIDDEVTAGRYITFYSKENADTSNRPKLRVYNLGATDETCYKADCGDYLTRRCIIGFATNTATTGNSVRAQVIGIINGLGTGNTGGFFYLNDTAGSITPDSYALGNAIRVAKIIKDGVALIDIQKHNIMIESNITTITGLNSAKTIYAPDDAQGVILQVEDSGSNGSNMVFNIPRNTQQTYTIRDYTGAASSYTYTIAWSSNNYFTISSSNANAQLLNYTFYT